MFSTSILPFLLALASPGDRAAPTVPDAVVDLRTAAGVELVGGPWRFREAHPVDARLRAPGPDRKASGEERATHDLSPKAGARDFDDAQWLELRPEELEERRGLGRLSFAWYRLRIVLPEHLGTLPVEGAALVFEVVADDYAEVWVDGELPLVLGQRGSATVAGWNAPNRVVLTRSASAGQVIQIALLVANAPLSDPPANFVWLRSATLDAYAPGRLDPAETVAYEVRERDPRLDDLLAPDARLERVASGFQFAEGPVWSAGAGLLFSDPNANVIHRWSEDEGLSIHRTKSGYSGLDIGRLRQPGSNGLAVDAQGRLLICEHGNRRLTRLERNGSLTVLADRYQGKRLNSPNDLILRGDGALYFTDPPFGLPGLHDDPARELSATGVYFLAGNELKLVADDLTGPNGVALSPDERVLYVANWDTSRKVVMRYDCAADGTLSPGRVLFDMGAAPGEEALDGLEVDELGNLYVCGPVGVWVLTPQGEHLGTLVAPELPANLAWGGSDGRTLFLTARSGLYRLPMSVRGADRRWHAQ
jgi:gluconolactonase